MLTIARAWKIDMKIGADSPGILAQGHNAIAEQNRLLNVVRNDEHGASVIEYALVASFIGVAIAAAIASVGINLSSTFQTVADNL